MINRVTLKHFKRFEQEVFDLHDTIILAGPNNAGKTILLQAIATWNLGLKKWLEQRSASRATKRTGVPITRQEFTAVPLREMNLLWESRQVAGRGEKPGMPRLLEIVLEGKTANKSWNCGLEFQYANPEMVYVRPLGAKKKAEQSPRAFPPKDAEDLQIVHIPPLSGIERDEPRRDRGYQDLLIGQGRPGEILRNLLFEVSQEKQQSWNELINHVAQLFHIDLLEPRYSTGQPFIVCEYREGQGGKTLDLANAGSGFLQVLLLLSFFYARPATVLLLDEPDAHLHVILQKEVYDLLRLIAVERNCQLIVATHSEVLLDATSPDRVLAFIGSHPRPLSHAIERDQLREAIKRLTTTDLILGKELGAILYVEGESDERILSEWARILHHPARKFLDRPNTHWLGGRSLKEARDHFFALRAAYPSIKGLCLLDGDNRDEADDEFTKAGLRVLRWRRYEIENYLLIQEVIKRFVNMKVGPLFGVRVDDEFKKQVPTGTDPFGDHVALVRVRASEEFLIPLLEKLGCPVPKKELYHIAAIMEQEEIHPEILEKLDAIAQDLLSDEEL